MATVATKLLTAEEFFDWANLPENRDRRFELEKGEIVEGSLPGERHCAVCGNFPVTEPIDGCGRKTSCSFRQ